MSEKAFFEKVGEYVPSGQLLATGMQAQTNLGYVKFGAGTYKAGQLVSVKSGIATKYTADVEIIDSGKKVRFAIVKDDFDVPEEVTAGNEVPHIVYLTGSFYRDYVETVSQATITMEHQLEMSAEGIWLSNQHI